MPAKLGILFLGMTVGGATFLAVGFACFLTIARLQYSTMQARAVQAALEANQVSTRAKNVPVIAGANGAEARYELVSNLP
jgi:hypothetical protein